MKTKWPGIQIKAGRYYWTVTSEERGKNGRRKVAWVGLTRVSEGEPSMLEALAEKKRAANPATRRGNLPDLLAEYMKVKLVELHSTYAQAEYRRILSTFGEEFEEFDVDQVTPREILGYLSGWAKKPTARKAIKARISSFFSWCVLAGKVTTNPCAEIRLSGAARRGARMTAERFHAIREHMPPLGQCILDMLFLSMQRTHDVRLLRESQIGDAVIEFTPTKTKEKTGKSVRVPITPEIQAVIDRARSMQRVRKVGQGDAYLFQIDGGTPYSKTGFNSMWRRAREAAGLTGVASTDVLPYAMSCASAAGYDVEQLQVARAHALVTTTAGYLAHHSTPDSAVRLSLPAKPKGK